MLFRLLQLRYQPFDFGSRGRSELLNKRHHLFIGCFASKASHLRSSQTSPSTAKLAAKAGNSVISGFMVTFASREMFRQEG
jgi:hypothetical protein